MMTLKELEIGQSNHYAVVGEGAAAATFFGYGSHPGSRDYFDQICTDGRSYGISGAWLLN